MVVDEAGKCLLTVLLGLFTIWGYMQIKFKKSFIFYIIVLLKKNILLMFLAVKCNCYNVCDVIMKGIKNGL